MNVVKKKYLQEQQHQGIFHHIPENRVELHTPTYLLFTC